MFIIVVYDIVTIEKKGEKRLRNILKLLRQYLHHTQKSVFEGDLTEGDIIRLRYEIDDIIDKVRDFVIIYAFPPSVRFDRIFLTDTPDPTSNIL